jgi:hypothetical protein
MHKRWEVTTRRRSLRYWLHALARAKTWQLIIVLILCVFISATFLRLNNLGMIEARQRVKTADVSGNSEAIRSSLAELQHYASGHMNAYPGVIYLQESYNRDYSEALAAAGSSHNSNSDIYQQASIACRERFQGGTASFRNDYVTCVAAAVSSLPPEQQQAINLPHPNSYRYSFSSPLMSLDIAGLATFVTVFLSVFILIKIIGVVALQAILKRRRTTL